MSEGGESGWIAVHSNAMEKGERIFTQRRDILSYENEGNSVLLVGNGESNGVINSESNSESTRESKSVSNSGCAKAEGPVASDPAENSSKMRNRYKRMHKCATQSEAVI